MERLSEQLDMAFTSFVHAFRAEIDHLEQKLAELDQKSTELEQSNAELRQTNETQRHRLDLLGSEQETTDRRINNVERKLEKQQIVVNEQNRSISLLQAENAALRSRFAESRELAAGLDQALPSREVTLDSQEFFSCGDHPSSPRSTTFAGDEVSFPQLPAEWHNLAASTPFSLRGGGNAARHKIDRKRTVTFQDSFDSTGTFKVPQMPTRQSRSRKARAQTVSAAQMDGLTEEIAANDIDPTIVNDNLASAARLRADTPIKDSFSEYDSENIIVACRPDKLPHGLPHMPQQQEVVVESMAVDEIQPAYSELLQQFNARIGEMQAAVAVPETESEASTEVINFCRGKGGRLRKNPRKSAWLVRQETDWHD